MQTMQYGGHWYGLSREAIECVAREGLACCVHMELEVQYGLDSRMKFILLVFLLETAMSMESRQTTNTRTRSFFLMFINLLTFWGTLSVIAYEVSIKLPVFPCKHFYGHKT